MIEKTVGAWCLAWCGLLETMSLDGCNQTPRGFNYSLHVPPHYQSLGEEEQIDALEADIEEIKALNGIVPAGYYAELGLLYLSLGKNEQKHQRSKAEKDPFTKSAAYRDAHMRNAPPKD